LGIYLLLDFDREGWVSKLCMLAHLELCFRSFQGGLHPTLTLTRALNHLNQVTTAEILPITSLALLSSDPTLRRNSGSLSLSNATFSLRRISKVPVTTSRCSLTAALTWAWNAVARSPNSLRKRLIRSMKRRSWLSLLLIMALRRAWLPLPARFGGVVS